MIKPNKKKGVKKSRRNKMAQECGEMTNKRYKGILYCQTTRKNATTGTILGERKYQGNGRDGEQYESVSSRQPPGNIEVHERSP